LERFLLEIENLAGTRKANADFLPGGKRAGLKTLLRGKNIEAQAGRLEKRLNSNEQS
jgi:hypothetical protein